jgi:hypothetical protein
VDAVGPPGVHVAAALSGKQLEHRRLGHPGEGALAALREARAVTGLDKGVRGRGNGCEACWRGKMRNGPSCGQVGLSDREKEEAAGRTRPPVEFKKKISLDTLVLPEKTLGGGVALVGGIDAETDLAILWVVGSRKPADIVKQFVAWDKLTEKQYGAVLKSVRTDGGGEFMGEFKEYLEQSGVRREVSAADQHNMNPLPERLWRTLCGRLRAVLVESGAPAFLAGEFAKALIVMRNCTITSKTKKYGMTPKELATGVRPDVSSFLPLGCYVLAHDVRPKNKYSSRGRLGVYVGPDPAGAGRVVRFRMVDIHCEPDRWPFKDTGFVQASVVITALGCALL